MKITKYLYDSLLDAFFKVCVFEILVKNKKHYIYPIKTVNASMYQVVLACCFLSQLD